MAATAPAVSREAAPSVALVSVEVVVMVELPEVMVEVTVLVVEPPLEDELEEDELPLLLLLPLVELDPEPVVVDEPVWAAPPRKEVAQTGRELAREESSGHSLRTDEMSSELLLYHELRSEL